MSLKLRDLIRQVRACKTASEERAVIAKESAMIRTAIREEQSHYRHRNVAKLLFMHMLGYPTHFGQLECMKLISSPHFPEKRIGYLGMMLLLSEEAEVLMLSTNGLKNDLNSDNKFVSGLALCAIGNLATADMSRDLAPEVDKHLKSTQQYLRKKACLAMARCLTKCPDMVEDFVDRVVTLLKDRSHGVLITVVQLMTQVLIVEKRRNDDMEEYGDEDEEDFGTPCQDAFVKLVPSLVKLLRNVTGGGYASSDSGGVTDVFLQVQILRLLRHLGVGNAKASEEMNDVLATVATNTETSKNSGNAILYECVQTIMAIESDDGLRVLAVNILGRFLLNRDNNIRYVALNTLSNCIVEAKRSVKNDLTVTTTTIDSSSAEGANTAAAALQKHRTTIVDCLKDPDISIRTRALELIYHLVNNENVESLSAELLNYLVLCPREHRSDICTRILRVVDKFSPNDRWRVDTLITMLTIAGREASPNVQSASIIYISRSSEDLRAYASHKLLKAIRDDDGTQTGLHIVGIWCIGEYGDLLLKPYSYTPASDMSDVTGGDIVSVSFTSIEPSIVVKTVEEIITRHTCPANVKERALTCFTKLSERYANCGDDNTVQKLHTLVKKHSKSYALELQLRSCEFDALINAMKGVSTKNDSASDASEDIFGVSEGGGSGAIGASVIAAAKEALARMPVVDIDVMQRKRTAGYAANGASDDLSVGEAQESKQPAAAETGGDLLDLNDIFGGAPASQPASTGVEQAPTMNNVTSIDVSSTPAPASDIDLLSDIFSAPAPAAPAAAPSAMNGGGYVDPFSSMANGNGTANGMANGTLNGTAMAPVPTPLDAFAPTPTPTSEPIAPAAPLDIFASPPVPAAAPTNTITVPGCTFGGLTIEFECSKPEPMNKNKSLLVAKFKNTNNAPIYGLGLQCAVPKYVTMEMKPPTATTVPAAGNNSMTTDVTQSITVTNTKLGVKNLMLKLKLGFTLNGQKMDNMTTVSGFPAGEY